MDREEIMRRFEALLDMALTPEAAPPGIDSDILAALGEPDDDNQQSDSYALWSAMTALTQEIKLQGRAFQELNLRLSTQQDKVASELRAVYAEREKTVQREGERRARREALSVLIDLRDRLGRGRESVSASEQEMAKAEKASWFQRVLQKPKTRPEEDALRALVRGYELGVERLDQALSEFSASEIRCQGEQFDPRRMNAIEIEESATVPANTVLQVYRSGYEWNGEVFRPAQVKVSREPSQL
jgi:molecular chaperone GrpE